MKEVKKDFPLLERKVHGKSIVYLDNAATSQKPLSVLKAIDDYYRTINSNVHRGVYSISQDATLAYEEAHRKAGDFINADMEETIFTGNTTESINLLASSLQAKKDIVLTEMEHHSNLLPWQRLAKKMKVKLKYIPLKNDFTLDHDAAVKLLKNSGIFSISHVSNALGTRNDVKGLMKIAKENDAVTVLDAAQSVPHLKVDVSDLRCDFLAFSGHKMLAPTGIGVLYGKKDMLEELPPFNLGGGMIKSVSWQDAEWNDLPWKFEAGTPNIEGGIGLKAAIDYLEKIGMKDIENHEHKLLKYAIEELSKVKGVTLYTPGAEKSTSVLSFNVDKVHSHDTASILDSEGICVRAGHHCCMPLMDKIGVSATARASFYLYNTFDDVDKLVLGIKKVQKVFR